MDNEKNEATPEIVSNKTPRITFSVSREFDSILSEIDTMPNMSRFVCEAIKEKLERVKNPGKEIADALANFVQIQSIISQPFQAPQSLPQAEGNTISTPSPSIPLAQEDTVDKKAESPSIKKEIKKEQTHDEPTIATEVIAKEETPVKAKPAEPVESVDNDYKAQIRDSYFRKG